MKRNFIYLVVIVFSFSACQDFLDVRAVGAVGEPDLLNKTGIDMALTGMYASMLNPTNYFYSTLTNYAWGDVMGGSANKGSTFNDQSDFTNLETYGITQDNSYLNGKWKSVYDGVFRANNVLSMTEKIKDDLLAIKGQSKDYYTETIAQGRFFRGFWHFEGVRLFGAAIPYIGSEEFASAVNPLVSNVDESGKYIYIWDKIIEDLEYAYANLPDIWTVDRGRANKWAAAAYLAKVKMYQSSPYNGTNNMVNRWTEVKSLLEAIMASGKDNNGTRFRLADNYADLFTAGKSDWTGESVFDVQLSISGTQTNTNLMYGSSHIGMSGALGTGGWGFFQPSYEMVNSYIVNNDGLPLLNGAYRDMAALTNINAGIPSTDLAVYTDPRLDVSVGRFNVPFWDWSIPVRTDGWIRDVGNGGLYLNKKYIPKKADKGSLSVATSTGSTAKNFHLIRYADVLLWYAEALIETGNHQEAREYVNQVRARAANSYVKAADPATMVETTSLYVLDDKVNGVTKTNAASNYRIGLYSESQFSTKEDALAALRFERKLELALEGQRWYDLARWGIIQSELSDYIDYEQQYLPKFVGTVYNEKWVTLPIPLDQIITMEGVLVQNENWK
ncbi:MAG: RagB/SusD family nutrient uptake outer membrane protein [Bacteroidia bacterium 43-41]|nr:MAG: RagB/SusD family nutrient uptake outer membrane protein [Bacteroidia bacterium 43-41]